MSSKKRPTRPGKRERRNRPINGDGERIKPLALLANPDEIAKDAELIRHAVREKWDVPNDRKRLITERACTLHDAAIIQGEYNFELSVMKFLAWLDRADVSDEKAGIVAQHNHAHVHLHDMRGVVSQLQENDEFVELVRERTRTDSADPNTRNLRGSVIIGPMGNGDPSGNSGPGGNGSDRRPNS